MSFLRNAASVGFATLISRILGFARDSMVASALGAGPAADAFVVAFRLPSLMRRLFAEGAINTAFVPLHGEARMREEGPAFSNQVFTWVVIFFTLATVAALAGMPLLIRLIAPGFAQAGGQIELATHLSRITFGYCLVTALTVVASAALNVHGRFAAAAYAPALVNVVTIAALMVAFLAGWREPERLAGLLAWTVLAGGLAQGALVFFALSRAGLSLRLVRPVWRGPSRRFFRLALPGVVAAGTTQVNAFVGLVIASSDPGAITWLYYADRIYQLPLGIIAVALGNALLPELARAGTSHDSEAAQPVLSRALEFAAFLSLPAALALMVLAEPITSVLFQRGAFQADDSHATALALMGFSAGLPAFAFAKVLQSVFFARARMRAPFLIALAGIAADVILSLTLFPVWRQAGIAFAAAASGWINLALLICLARRQGILKIDTVTSRRLPRLALAALLMAVAVLSLAQLLGEWLSPGQPLLVRATSLAFVCGAGLLFYLALCRIVRATEDPLPWIKGQ